MTTQTIDMDSLLFISHDDMVKKLFKNGDAILSTITPDQLTRLHAVVGISGEAGELLDAVKKETMYNKKPDLENIIEELGDLEFYMEALRQAYDITREQTIRANIAKLGVRYSSGTYSDKQAQERADKQ
mgnify:FL=1